MATGRTPSKYVKLQIEDSGGTLRDIPVNSFGGVGLEYEEVDLTALQDAVMGFMSGQPDFALDISGPLDNTAVQGASSSGSAPALSGSHTVLSGVNGGTTPLGFGLYVGIQGHWSSGDPVFGLSSTSTNGVLVFSYTFDPPNYTARIRMSAGSAAPSWGTSAIT